MRIRTIKPEFWSHPMTGRWPGDLQALAIGALNMADDEGYFRADPMLVRAALRPFDDDSSNVRRGLDELSRTGWIEVREHADDGAIALVRNFAKHQKIDRPQPSKLRKLFEASPFVERSTNDRRAFVERSLLEQGTGNREMEQGKDLSSPPAAVDTGVEDLHTAWNAHKAPAMPAWRDISPDRARAARARINEHGLEVLVEAIKRLARSDFASGRGGGWAAPVDWFLKPKNLTKTLEGNYDNKSTTKGSIIHNQTAWTADDDAVAGMAGERG